MMAPVAFFNLPQSTSSSVGLEKTIMMMSMEEEAEDYSTTTTATSSSSSSENEFDSFDTPTTTTIAGAASPAGPRRHRSGVARRKSNTAIAAMTVAPSFAIRKESTPLCPCCNLPLHATKHQKVVSGATGNGIPKIPSRLEAAALLRDGSRQTIHSVMDDDDDDHLDEEMERMMPGVLGLGVAYTVREVIAQGYLRKKGSGFDWMGSRAWKVRWAVLARARVDGHDVDVPLLQIFWTSTSPTVSTVISLDSAVVIPENNLDPDNGNSFRLKIRHVKKSVSSNDPAFQQLTRVFSCPKESRDDWVYTINHALLEYEKEKANARRLSGMLCLSPPRRKKPCMSEDVAVSSDKLRRQRKQELPPTLPVPSL